MPGRLSRWGIRQPAIAPDGLPNVPPTTPPILAYSDPSSDVGASGLDSVRLGALANSEARTSEGRSFWRASFAWSAWLASTIVHCSLLIALSMLLLVAPRDDLLWLSGVSAPQLADEWDVELDESPLDETAPSLGAVPAVDSLALPGPTAESVGSLRTGPEASGISFDGGSAPLDPLAPVGETAAGAFAADMAALSSPLTTRGGGLQGRQLENRLALALSGGGTRESEEAVERGLAWLAEHQFEDGSWRFDLQSHPQCAGYCRDSGTYKSRTAATGLALLSFLGAGYTHQQGPYQDQVLRGLYYLTERMAITSHGGDLRDSGSDLQAQIERGLAGGGALPVFRRDTMYSHAIASLAITEAYAMTRDRSLRQPAQDAVSFVINAQYDDGGWRYAPRWENPGAGDMTVTGWQLMVLKSALLAGIDVPYDVWRRASDFLDTLQLDGGSRYVYVQNERGTPATTAIGLLCRMIGGWPRDARPLQRGASVLGDQSPAKHNIYYIYYASQVLHHLGGPRWEKWNPKVREYLVKSQSREGHETGSWYFAEAHSTPGGRLYTTAMAIMTLEVYYRYMPLYMDAFVDQGP